MKKLQLTMVAVSLAAAMSAQAAVIPLWNTGVDAGGTSLTDGTIGDPHYSLILVPGGTTDIRIRTSTGGYPIPPYLPDTAISTWIGPNNDGAVNGPVGTYVYRTTFDLTGLNPSTATIFGGWSSDNDGINIYLNGNAIAGPTSFSQFSVGYAAFSTSTSSFFVSGVNTLDFALNNGGGPTALRVEMTGFAAAVPEPTTIVAGALLLLPFGASTLRMLRKSRTE